MFAYWFRNAVKKAAVFKSIILLIQVCFPCHLFFFRSCELVYSIISKFFLSNMNFLVIQAEIIFGVSNSIAFSIIQFLKPRVLSFLFFQSLTFIILFWSESCLGSSWYPWAVIISDIVKNDFCIWYSEIFLIVTCVIFESFHLQLFFL